jgi:hypothetical protein
VPTTAAELPEDHEPLRSGALTALVQDLDEVGGGCRGVR